MASVLVRSRTLRHARSRAGAFLPDRFGLLMGLYEENYRRLTRLFAPHRLAIGEYQSSVGDGLDVLLSIQERHPYTIEIGLSYGVMDASTGHPAPSAQLRMYLDAHVAEALHCEPGRDLWQVLGPLAPARNVMQHRLRMNSFLDRWLEYLAEQGHSLGSLERMPGRTRSAADTD
jgi:uncharacterized protein